MSTSLEVLLFAGLAERLGERRLVLDPAPADVGALREQLTARWPALAGRPFRVSVGRAYADDDQALRPGDEVALIPPVSGG